MCPDSKKQLEELLSLPLEERIEAVARDLKCREKKYSLIDAYSLAEALGVELDDVMDAQWSIIEYVPIHSLETLIEGYCQASDFVYFFEGLVSQERFDELEKQFKAFEDGEVSNLDFVTPEERRTVETKIAEEEESEGRIHRLATYTLVTGSGDQLRFEAEVGCGGYKCPLRTPYDEMEGNFTNLDGCYLRF